MILELPVADVRVRPRRRKDLGDIDALAASIERLGLLHPIVVLPDNTLAVGERRLAAYRKLGRDSIPANVAKSLVDASRFLEAERDENTCRKGFTPEEAVAVADGILEAAKEDAKKSHLEGSAKGGKNGRRGGDQQDKAGKSYPSLKRDESKRSEAVAASSVGMSRVTLTKAREVVQAAAAEPEKFARLVERMNATGKVSGVHRQLKIARQAQAIASEPPPLPTGPFRVLVVDPPWKYDNRSVDPTHRGSNPYPSMTVEQIKSLPVGPLAETDAVLWLWVTNAHQRYAYEIAEAWGFTHKATLTWVKQQIGLGDYLRNRTEHCLLCVRGRPTLTLSGQDTALIASRGEHSQKPAAFYELVESLCPGSKVELFSRCNRPGWMAWGDECGTLSGGKPQRETVTA